MDHKLKFLGLMMVVYFFQLFSCGIKQEPKPLKTVYAPPVMEIQAQLQDACIELNWNYWEEENPKQFLLLRRETKVDRTNFSEPKILAILDPDQRTYLDCAIQPGYDYGYCLIFFSKLGIRSEEGKIVWVSFP